MAAAKTFDPESTRCEAAPASWDELYDAFGEPVFRLLHRMIRCPDVAADLTHDTFVRVFEKMHLYDGRGALGGERAGASAGYCSQVTRSGLAAAAGILVFLLGAEYGRRTATSWVEPTRPPAPVSPAHLPADIQAKGTDYVTALTRFSDRADALTPFEREQACQVALAVLYGASLELMRAAPEDPIAASVYRSIAAERDEERASDGQPAIHWF